MKNKTDLSELIASQMDKNLVSNAGMFNKVAQATPAPAPTGKLTDAQVAELKRQADAIKAQIGASIQHGGTGTATGTDINHADPTAAALTPAQVAQLQAQLAQIEAQINASLHAPSPVAAAPAPVAAAPAAAPVTASVNFIVSSLLKVSEVLDAAGLDKTATASLALIDQIVVEAKAKAKAKKDKKDEKKSDKKDEKKSDKNDAKKPMKSMKKEEKKDEKAAKKSDKKDAKK